MHLSAEALPMLDEALDVALSSNSSSGSPSMMKGGRAQGHDGNDSLTPRCVVLATISRGKAA